MTSLAPLSDQVNALIQENTHLRLKSEADDNTIGLLKQQYGELSGRVNKDRDQHARQIHDLRTERDQAVVKFREIDGLLMQATQLIMQALRARNGDGTPDPMPVAEIPYVADERLPVAMLS